MKKLKELESLVDNIEGLGKIELTVGKNSSVEIKFYPASEDHYIEDSLEDIINFVEDYLLEGVIFNEYSYFNDHQEDIKTFSVLQEDKKTHFLTLILNIYDECISIWLEKDTKAYKATDAILFYKKLLAKTKSTEFTFDNNKWQESRIPFFSLEMFFANHMATHGWIEILKYKDMDREGVNIDRIVYYRPSESSSSSYSIVDVQHPRGHESGYDSSRIYNRKLPSDYGVIGMVQDYEIINWSIFIDWVSKNHWSSRYELEEYTNQELVEYIESLDSSYEVNEQVFDNLKGNI